MEGSGTWFKNKDKPTFKEKNKQNVNFDIHAISEQKGTF